MTRDTVGYIILGTGGVVERFDDRIFPNEGK